MVLIIQSILFGWFLPSIYSVRRWSSFEGRKSIVGNLEFEEGGWSTLTVREAHEVGGN